MRPQLLGQPVHAGRAGGKIAVRPLADEDHVAVACIQRTSPTPASSSNGTPPAVHRSATPPRPAAAFPPDPVPAAGRVRRRRPGPLQHAAQLGDVLSAKRAQAQQGRLIVQVHQGQDAAQLVLCAALTRYSSEQRAFLSPGKSACTTASRRAAARPDRAPAPAASAPRRQTAASISSAIRPLTWICGRRDNKAGLRAICIIGLSRLNPPQHRLAAFIGETRFCWGISAA